MTPVRSATLGQAVVEALEVGIWLLGEDGRVIYRNAWAEALAPGAASAQDLGERLQGVPFREYVRQIQGGETAVTDPIALMRHEGRVRQVELRLCPGPASVPGTLMLTVSEIRWRPKWVRALAEMSQELSHGINNPLAILSGEIELLSRDRNVPRRRIERMRIAADRIRDLIGRLRQAAEALAAAGGPALGRDNPREREKAA